MSDEGAALLPAPLTLERERHFMHCRRCLMGLPGREVGHDESRMAIVFYCLGSMDLLSKKLSTETHRDMIEGIWNLQSSQLTIA